jgi:hypothetical protein
VKRVVNVKVLSCKIVLLCFESFISSTVQCARCGQYSSRKLPVERGRRLRQREREGRDREEPVERLQGVQDKGLAREGDATQSQRNYFPRKPSDLCSIWRSRTPSSCRARVFVCSTPSTAVIFREFQDIWGRRRGPEEVRHGEAVFAHFIVADEEESPTAFLRRRGPALPPDDQSAAPEEALEPP